MKHDGPLPDEALPVGEEVLTPGEVDSVAGVFFQINLLAEDQDSDIIDPDETPEEQSAAEEAA
jgi:hypothetical protein